MQIFQEVLSGFLLLSRRSGVRIFNFCTQCKADKNAYHNTMTDHSINIMVSSSLARQCYSMLMLMTLWWLSALIQMTSADILELGSQSDIGMLWHILSLARSSADGSSSTCCVISQPSYRNQTWLNTFCPQQGQSTTIRHASEIKLVILLWLLAMWSCHIVYGKFMRCHLSILFGLLLIAYLNFFAHSGFTVFLSCIWTGFPPWGPLLVFGWLNQSYHLGLGSFWPSVCHSAY